MFLTAPTADVLARVVDGLRPDFEPWTAPRDDYGSVRTFVVRIETSGILNRAPRVARRAAAVAYDLGATRVEYFHEAMENTGPQTATSPERHRTADPGRGSRGAAVTV